MADRELFCKDSFDRLLQTLELDSRWHWERVARGDDPPDFWLTIGSQLFPVEITSTEPVVAPKLKGQGVPQETYEASHRAIVQSVQASAIAEGVLSGSYVVAFDGPLAGGDNFYAIKTDFEKALIGVLIDLAEFQSGAHVDIRMDGIPVARVHKINEQGARLHTSFEDGAWVKSPEFVDYVGAMLHRAVHLKWSKIAHIDHSEHAILLLLNTYPLAEPTLVSDLADLLPHMQLFHTLCLVSVNGGAQIIHSVNENWRDAKISGAP